MEAVIEEGEEFVTADESAWDYELDLSQMCRVCANPNEYLIPIFQGEGLEHDLNAKIRKHLPIKVTKTDKLPTQLCYQCASTLIAWHDLVLTCAEANEKLNFLLRDDKPESDTNEAEEISRPNSAEPLSQVEKNIEVKPFQLSHAIEADLIEEKNEEQQLSFGSSDRSEKLIVEDEEIIMKDSESTNTRCLDPFSTYHQIQSTLRMQYWGGNSCAFCMLCGKMTPNQTMLIKHLNWEHTIRCGHCRANFANKDSLAEHMSTHEYKKSTVQETSSCSQQNDNNFKKHKPNYLTDSSFPVKTHLQEQSQNKLKSDSQSLSQTVSSKCCFHCDSCSSMFSRRFDLKRHRLKHHSVKIYEINGKENNGIHLIEKSNLKGETTSNSKDPNNPIEKNNFNVEDDMDYTELTDNSFVNSEDFRADIRAEKCQAVIKTESVDQYSCSLCAYTCRRKQDMLIHQRKDHLQKENSASISDSGQTLSSKPFLCSMCEKSYLRSSDLQRHILKKHESDEFVGKHSDTVDDMDVEIINKAKQDIDGTVVYHCDECDRNIFTRRGFVRHIRSHTGERPFTCHVCGKQYKTNADLIRHLKCVHEGVKNYPCDICGRNFANKGTRNDHRRTHTGEKPYMCHICGKSFPTANTIYVHRRIHTDYFPHQCTSCNKKFRRKQQLDNHHRTHTGEKPHTCDMCGKRFCTKNEVARHKLTHSSDKPHACILCGLSFGQKRYLANHCKTHHSKTM